MPIIPARYRPTGWFRRSGSLLLLISLILAPSHSRALKDLQDHPPRCDWSQQAYDDFYTTPDLSAVPRPQSGDVMRVEYIRSYSAEEVAKISQLLSSAYGAAVYRILYLSQAPAGISQAVSSLMIVPIGSAQAAGFPIIAYAHGTTGLGDSAAPSKYPNLSVLDLLPWIAKGYLVAATDYVGLGMPGPHPYIVGAAEGWSVLDSARSALRFCDTAHGFSAPVAANNIFLMGHSQGGHAALFAHQLWAEYAPELNILGAVAFAPASELRTLIQQLDADRTAVVIPALLLMYAYSRYYGSPATLQEWLREPYATELPDRVERLDPLSLGLWIGFNPRAVFQPSVLSAIQNQRWDNLQPWTTYMDVNTPGNYSNQTPVLLLQGTDDTIVPAKASEQLARRLCSHGTLTKLKLYPNVGHNIPRVSYPEAMQWIADRLAGQPILGNCQFQGAPGQGISRHAFLPLLTR